MTKRFFIGWLVVASVLAGSAFAQQPSGALGRIKAAKAINVAYSTESLPFSFKGPDNQPAGYSIDLCKRVIAQIGRAVGEPDLKVNWIAGTTPQRLEMVASGKADLECANTSQTLSRLANVDFSSLIFLDAGGILLRSDSTATKLSDLSGKKIAVLKGTTTEARLRAALDRALVNATVVPINDANEGIALVESGGADAYAGDKIKLVGLIAQAKDPTKFRMPPDDLSFEPYAFALSHNDSALRLEVNRALTQIYLGPEIAKIFNQWFGPLGSPSGLLAAMYLLYSIPQ